MRKSIPVSDDLNAYFTDPCPVLSANNTQFILNEIARGYEWIIEYGMGASTLYFLHEAQKQNGKMVSVEINYDWFKICVQEIKKQTGFKKTSHTYKPWSLCDLDNFIKSDSNASVPMQVKRFPKWQDSLATGPFFRFSPDAKSRFSGKLGHLWPVLKPVFKILAKGYYLLFPAKRPVNGEWRGHTEGFELILRNVGPSIKDQFGEAPNMTDYINAGLRDIRTVLEGGQAVSALFIIDGGPRHKIVQALLDLEEQYETFRPTIILCDAARAFYREVLERRPTAKFMAGTNKTLKGDRVANDVNGPDAEFWTGGPKTGDELAQKEVWYYSAV